jgi:integrase
MGPELATTPRSSAPGSVCWADIRRVQEWMGHADIRTTMKYLHYESREEDADLVARASRTEQVGDPQGVRAKR